MNLTEMMQMMNPMKRADVLTGITAVTRTTVQTPAAAAEAGGLRLTGGGTSWDPEAVRAEVPAMVTARMEVQTTGIIMAAMIQPDPEKRKAGRRIRVTQKMIRGIITVVHKMGMAGDGLSGEEHRSEKGICFRITCGKPAQPE